MHLSVESASGLPSPDGQTGDANAYVVATLGDDHGSDHRTAVKANSRSPQWGEHFEWTGFKGEMTATSLILEVRSTEAALPLTLTLTLSLTLTLTLTFSLTFSLTFRLTFSLTLSVRLTRCATRTPSTCRSTARRRCSAWSRCR